MKRALWSVLRAIDARLYPQGQPGWGPTPPPPPPPPWDGKIPMSGPLPPEALRNMPRWVRRLDSLSGWLCVPFAIAFLLAMLYQRTGILIP